MKFIARGHNVTHTFTKYDDELYQHTMKVKYDDTPWEAPSFLTQDELFDKLEEMSTRYVIICER